MVELDSHPHAPAAEMRAAIERQGWFAVHVGDDGNAAAYSYSIGFEQSCGHPEIVVFGLQPAAVCAIFADLYANLRAGARYEPLERLDTPFGADLEVMFRPVRDQAFRAFLSAGVNYYKRPFRAWVMLWPDLEGRLPGEAGCRATSQDDALAIAI